MTRTKASFDLEKALAALPRAAEDRLPSLPVKVLVQEARQAIAVARSRRERFAALPGFDVAELERASQIADALDAQEAAWRIERSQAQSLSAAEVRRQALALRRDILHAARWLLRRDEAGLNRLDTVSGGGRTLADLSFQLKGLASMLEEDGERLGVGSLLPADAAERADDLGGQLCRRRSREPSELLARRNRLAALLEQRLAEIRWAARVLLRGEPALLAQMSSQYNVERCRRHRKAARSRLAPPR